MSIYIPFIFIICYLLLGLAILLPIDPFLKGVKGISKPHILFALIFLLIFMLVLWVGLSSLINIALLLVLLCLLLFSLSISRKYIYLMALFSLLMTAFLLLLQVEKIAEQTAVITFLFLTLGLMKDMFYETILSH